MPLCFLSDSFFHGFFTFSVSFLQMIPFLHSPTQLHGFEENWDIMHLGCQLFSSSIDHFLFNFMICWVACFARLMWESHKQSRKCNQGALVQKGWITRFVYSFYPSLKDIIISATKLWLFQVFRVKCAFIILSHSNVVCDNMLLLVVMCSFFCVCCLFQDFNDLLVLSLGTGQHPMGYDAREAARWGVIDWLVNKSDAPLVDMVFNASADMVDYNLSIMFQSQQCGANYLRIQVPKTLDYYWFHNWMYLPTCESLWVFLFFMVLQCRQCVH